jgi:hypothetical protein
VTILLQSTVERLKKEGKGVTPNDPTAFPDSDLLCEKLFWVLSAPWKPNRLLNNKKRQT